MVGDIATRRPQSSRLVTPPRLDRRRAVIVIGCLISGVSMWALILLSG